MPEQLKPKPPTVSAGTKKREIDGSWLAIVTNWRLVLHDLSVIHHIDLFDPVVRARPWLGVRTMIFGLLDIPGSLLREALTRR